MRPFAADLQVTAIEVALAAVHASVVVETRY
jgi:hypothetical protein